MAKYVTESARRVAVAKAYDVVILGGGIAGAAAALAAARLGAKVCVVEKQGALGGLATLGNVTIYLPLCDGMGHQVSGGLSEELLKLSVSDGFAEVPKCWRQKRFSPERLKQRYRVPFNPTYYLIAMERALLGAGVDIWYDTRGCEVVRGKSKLSALVVENKSGRLAIKGDMFVDASGDADLCAWAGEATVSLDSNVRCGWFYYDDGAGVKLVPQTKPYDPAGKVLKKSGAHFAGDCGKGVSGQIIGSRELIAQKMKELQKKSKKRLDVVLVPTIATTRMTRRLAGAYEITKEDDHRYFEDTVGMVGDWRKAGPIYCVPYRSLTGGMANNLITAGRCISVSNPVWDVMRAIQSCAVSGEAAGTAAALAVRERVSLKRLSLPTLQQQLRKQKVILDETLTRLAN